MEMKKAAIYVDGTRHEVDPGEGKNLLEVCLSLGYDLPYFCWHPAMHSVGACRQCAVKLFKDEGDTRGRIIMSCMTAVADGMRISIADEEAREARKGVVEMLMVNHPHDCPVCDEGGECHLQDMTVMTGHNYRDYRFTKRTHTNQDLGPFLNHEMNRCIQCYRCVRFYRDYAGGSDFAVQGWHDNVYFGRASDGPLENEFSGNLSEVCPTGVFTDKTYKAHYARKWDLHTAPSICAHCGVGCNLSPGETEGTIRRIQPRFNAAVNGYFICDRGRFGYEYAAAESRIRFPLRRRPGGRPVAAAETVSEKAALEAAGAALRGSRIVGIGSARASVESNFALRELCGPGRFFAAVDDAQLELQRLMARILAEGPGRSASVDEASKADAVFVLGEDAWASAPILGLALRQASRRDPERRAMDEKRIPPWDDAAVREAVQEERGPFYVAAPGPTGMDFFARETYRAAPDDLVRLGFAVAHAIDPSAPAVEGLDAAALELASRIAASLVAARQSLVVSGSSLGSEALVRAAGAVVAALAAAGKQPLVSFVFPEADSLGALLLASGGLQSAARELGSGAPAVLVVLEADLERVLGAAGAARLMGSAAFRILIDHTQNGTAERAELVLPSATVFESSGSMVSSEGRAQRFFAVLPSPEPAREAWRWIAELAGAAGLSSPGAGGLDALIAEIERKLPVFSGLAEAAPGADFRVRGMRVPRGSPRETSRTARYANVDVHEAPPTEDRDAPLSHSMEGLQGRPPSSLASRFWAPGWNSDQALHKFQDEVGGSLKDGDSGVRLLEPRDGTAGAAPYGSPPEAFAPREGELLVLPRAEVFGSEELSSLSPAVRARVGAAYLALGREDAERLGLAEGSKLRLQLAGARGAEAVSVELPVRIEPMPRGVAAAPLFVAPIPAALLPGRAVITEAKR